MEDKKKFAIIVTQGTLDWAYPPFILGSTAAALGYKVQMYFTFFEFAGQSDVNLSL